MTCNDHDLRKLTDEFFVQVLKSGPGVPGPGPGWEYTICVLVPELWIFYLTRLKVRRYLVFNAA